jgi:hypothetical protein
LSIISSFLDQATFKNLFYFKLSSGYFHKYPTFVHKAKIKQKLKTHHMWQLCAVMTSWVQWWVQCYHQLWISLVAEVCIAHIGVALEVKVTLWRNFATPFQFVVSACLITDQVFQPILKFWFCAKNYLRINALSFYRSKIILDHPNFFRRVQFVLVRSIMFWLGPKHFGQVQIRLFWTIFL